MYKVGRGKAVGLWELVSCVILMRATLVSHQPVLRNFMWKAETNLARKFEKDATFSFTKDKHSSLKNYMCKTTNSELGAPWTFEDDRIVTGVVIHNYSLA